jgi:hypothetical protein
MTKEVLIISPTSLFVIFPKGSLRDDPDACPELVEGYRERNLIFNLESTLERLRIKLKGCH